jgi:hypothetical protein
MRIRLTGHVAGMGETINVYNILVANPEGKRPLLGRTWCTWEDNIKTDLRQMERSWEDVDYIHLAQERVQWRHIMNTVMAGNFLSS